MKDVAALQLNWCISASANKMVPRWGRPSGMRITQPQSGRYLLSKDESKAISYIVATS